MIYVLSVKQMNEGSKWYCKYPTNNVTVRAKKAECLCCKKMEYIKKFFTFRSKEWLRCRVYTRVYVFKTFLRQ